MITEHVSRYNESLFSYFIVWKINNVDFRVVDRELGARIATKMEEHADLLARLCRICATFCTASKRITYLSTVVPHIFIVFGMNISKDIPSSHPASFCYLCYHTITWIMESHTKCVQWYLMAGRYTVTMSV